jgi:type IV secretion system protein VirD4
MREGAGQEQKGGFVYGYTKGYYLFDAQTYHTIVCSPPGGGKTRRVLLPTIHLLMLAGESMVVCDPKGELFTYTALALKEAGYTVSRLDWSSPRLSDEWDPLDAVTEAYERGDLSLASARAADLAYSLIPTIKGSDPFWADISRALLKASLLLVATCPDADRICKTLPNVKLSIVNLLAVANTQSKNKETKLDKAISALPIGHPARDAYDPVIAARQAGNLTASIFTTALTALSLVGDPNIASMSQHTDLALNQLGQKKCAVFLITPSERPAYSMFPALYLQQAFESSVAVCKQGSGSLPVRLNFICEEFGQLPVIQDFARKVSESRGYNMRFLLAIQSIGQLEDNYSPSIARTILEDCRVKMFLQTGDPLTARYFSEILGNYTIETDNASTSKREGLGSAANISAGTSLAGRPLLMPEELMLWDSSEGNLLFRVGKRPCRIPSPDLSLLPANSVFGMGSEEHNRTLYAERNRQWAEHPPARRSVVWWIYGQGILSGKKAERVLSVQAENLAHSYVSRETYGDLLKDDDALVKDTLPRSPRHRRGKKKVVHLEDATEPIVFPANESNDKEQNSYDKGGN